MKAEIIAIGTELLIGDVVNTNAAWISKELAALGIDVFYHQTVGDNPARIQGVVKTALERANVLIFTGGLGPTDDDLTIATLADLFKAPLEADPASEEKIRNYFITRDMPMSKLNLKQALKPVGAETLSNPIGTAPGILWDVSESVGKPTYILTFPGVPKELYAMWPTGKAFLQAKQQAMGEKPSVLLTHFLHFFGIGESKLGELLRDLMQQETPTVAPYVGKAEVNIRIASKGKTLAEAQALIDPVREEILKRCGDYYFGENGTRLEEAIGALMSSQNQTVAVAESCTGGLVSSRLTDVPGSSRYVHLNMVTYGNAEKTRYLNVDPALLQTKGAVSPETSQQMAAGIRQVAGSDFGLSLTGIAGPAGATEEKPVGLVYIAVAGPNEAEPIVKKVLVNRNYGRVDIKHWFSQYALYFLWLALQGKLTPDNHVEAPLSTKTPAAKP
jgi:nicotinamide-nucleotide amidase